MYDLKFDDDRQVLQLVEHSDQDVTPSTEVVGKPKSGPSADAGPTTEVSATDVHNALSSLCQTFYYDPVKYHDAAGLPGEEWNKRGAYYEIHKFVADFVTNFEGGAFLPKQPVMNYTTPLDWLLDFVKMADGRVMTALFYAVYKMNAEDRMYNKLWEDLFRLYASDVCRRKWEKSEKASTTEPVWKMIQTRLDEMERKFKDDVRADGQTGRVSDPETECLDLAVSTERRTDFRAHQLQTLGRSLQHQLRALEQETHQNEAADDSDGDVDSLDCHRSASDANSNAGEAPSSERDFDEPANNNNDADNADNNNDDDDDEYGRAVAMGADVALTQRSIFAGPVFRERAYVYGPPSFDRWNTVLLSLQKVSNFMANVKPALLWSSLVDAVKDQATGRAGARINILADLFLLVAVFDVGSRRADADELLRIYALAGTEIDVIAVIRDRAGQEIQRFLADGPAERLECVDPTGERVG